MCRLFHYSIKGIVASLFLTMGSGCAIHYYDPKTGTEHIWGIGHMAMKASVPEEGLKAVIRGSDVIGVGGGRSSSRSYFVVGWDKSQLIEITDEDTNVRLEWPQGDFVNIRIGSEAPKYFTSPEKTLP